MEVIGKQAEEWIAGEFWSSFYDVSSLGAETGPDGTELYIQKRQSEVLVFLPTPLCPGPPFVPSDTLVGEWMFWFYSSYISISSRKASMTGHWFVMASTVTAGLASLRSSNPCVRYYYLPFGATTKIRLRLNKGRDPIWD